MTDERVLLSALDDGVLTLTLNRPRKLNAMSHEVFAALDAAVAGASDDRAVRVVVITGAGTVFCAGADLSMVQEFSDLPSSAFRETLRRLQSVFDRLEQLKKPVIAALNGACVGGGVDLALACDLRIAATDAYVMIPEARLGLIPDLGATQRLPRLIGVSRAKDLILTGRRVRADECMAMGLVNRVVARDQLAAAIAEMDGSVTLNLPAGQDSPPIKGRVIDPVVLNDGVVAAAAASLPELAANLRARMAELIAAHADAITGFVDYRGVARSSEWRGVVETTG